MVPNDGIITRFYRSQNSVISDDDVIFIETSTPGLKGQSGGPIFDRDGNIAALQNKTYSRTLDFHPIVSNAAGALVEENQVLNCGIGVHSKTICDYMDHYGVNYYRADCDKDSN